jgi:hypothetical protein
MTYRSKKLNRELKIGNKVFLTWPASKHDDDESHYLVTIIEISDKSILGDFNRIIKGKVMARAYRAKYQCIDFEGRIDASKNTIIKKDKPENNMRKVWW